MLDEPAGSVLADFRDHQGAVSAWFAVLALSAALLAPIAIGVGRLSTARAMRIAVPVGIAAAVVQVIGLLRWPILVPGYASDAASGDAAVAAAGATRSPRRATSSAPRIGETLGYLLTAAWTVLVVVALGRRFAGRWFAVLGGVSAALVLVGVLSPLGLPVVDTANFFGYVLWSVWLIALRRRHRSSASAVPRARRSAAARRAPERVMSRPRARWLALAVLCLSLLAIVLDNTIVNVALPTLVRDLDADVSDLQWVVDAYTLVFAGAAAARGRLGDRFGRRRTLLGRAGGLRRRLGGGRVRGRRHRARSPPGR